MIHLRLTSINLDYWTHGVKSVQQSLTFTTSTTFYNKIIKCCKFCNCCKCYKCCNLVEGCLFITAQVSSNRKILTLHMDSWHMWICMNVLVHNSYTTGPAAGILWHFHKNPWNFCEMIWNWNYVKYNFLSKRPTSSLVL